MDRELIALGIRQPWAELILRGIKTIEIRSTGTNHRGPIYVYASKKLADQSFAQTAADLHGIDLDALPRGVLVGTVEISDCLPADEDDTTASCVPANYLDGRFAWHLKNPTRLKEPLTPRFLPYGVWFYPFKRRGSQKR